MPVQSFLLVYLGAHPENQVEFLHCEVSLEHVNPLYFSPSLSLNLSLSLSLSGALLRSHSLSPSLSLPVSETLSTQYMNEDCFYYYS